MGVHWLGLVRSQRRKCRDFLGACGSTLSLFGRRGSVEMCKLDRFGLACGITGVKRREPWTFCLISRPFAARAEAALVRGWGSFVHILAETSASWRRSRNCLTGGRRRRESFDAELGDGLGLSFEHSLYHASFLPGAFRIPRWLQGTRPELNNGFCPFSSNALTQLVCLVL